MKILVVDDLHAMRRVICHILRSLGYREITQAEDGASAIDKLNRQQFDFVITDWNMPGTCGLELLKYIRANRRFAKLPVLMITAEGSRDKVLVAANAGVSSYITKPFSAAILSRKINKLFPQAV